MITAKEIIAEELHHHGADFLADNPTDIAADIIATLHAAGFVVVRECQVYPDTFEGDCMKWRGQLLTGKYAHTCWEWDGLPIDETCEEWPCGCQAELDKYFAAQGGTET